MTIQDPSASTAQTSAPTPVGSAPVASPDSGIALACLMGAPAPADLAGNLACLLALPEEVQAAYSEALQANLQPVIDDRVETRMKRFCRRFEIDSEQLAPSIKACRFLFTSSVKAGASREDFIADVKALLSEDKATMVLDRLIPLFDEAFPQLMQAAAFQSIAEHGKVVRAVHWRMDVIKGSDHVMKLDMPVATITLQYQEGPNSGQASYQLMPEQAAELKRALSMLVG